MIEQTNDSLRQLVRKAIPSAPGQAPERDLWPRMLQRLSEPAVPVRRLDWLLAALPIASVALFPKLLPLLLYLV